MNAVLLTEKALAAQLGISVRTVQHWRQNGWGPRFVKLSRGRRSVVRYLQADVDEFVEAARRAAERQEEGRDGLSAA